MKKPVGHFPLYPRKKNTDKSAYGHTLVVAGSRGMTGAAVLAVTAAIHSGSGLTTLATPASLLPVFSKRLPPEAMTLGLPDSAGALTDRAFLPISEFMKKKRVNAVAVGPGLSLNPKTQSLARRLVRSLKAAAIVLDADGLNAFKGRAKDLRSAARLVLTPHDREFERLFGVRCPKTGSARIALAKKMARFYDVVLVLKGHRTIVASPGHLYVNSTGNAGMAKGGAGDVLTGMIAAFLAQRLDPFQAASWAVYFHGRSGDLAVKKTGELSLSASDLILHFPRAFRGD